MTWSPADASRPAARRLTAFARSVPRADGHFDEWRHDDGSLRGPWQTFADRAGDPSLVVLGYAARRIARQIEENGVTYTVYGSGDGGRRPWALDALPMLVSVEDWDAIEPGLRQCGRLLDAIARDIYGDRHLVGEGLLPPGLLFPHPGFLRACQGVTPPGGVFLHTLAVDLARGPDGGWQIIGIRAQAPSGLGYALENRATVARVFPEALRDLRARSLMPFCDALQEVLLSSAPCESGPPQLVLLTPGRFSETYFEHAYLARQFGVPLVEGGDLTVRHDRVFLKTVSGLQPVHAIWRRLDDDYSDPLELRPDSTLGVPGLVEAWRAGHVLVANAFGLRVLESPALLGLLPALADRLLGAPLVLPAVPTTWPIAADHPAVRSAAFDDFVIKPALASTSEEPVFGRELDSDRRADWSERLAADPSRYVLQVYTPLSQAPVFHDGVVDSRGLMLRAFLVTDGQGDYRVLPGGLSRVAGSDLAVVSGHRGGGSKDTWVLSAAPAEVVIAPSFAPHPVAVGERSTPSRVAEHLFWLGRYAERSENVARLLRAVLSRLGDATMLPRHIRDFLIETCVRQGLLESEEASAPAGSGERGADSMERSLIAGLADRTVRQSLGFNVAQLERVAGSVRDRLSSDNWRVLHGLAQRLLSRDTETLELGEALEALDDAVLALVAIGGLEMAHMTRDDGWRFLSLGRHLERLTFVAATVDDLESEDATREPALLEWLLDLSDSLITYRARYVRRPEWPAVVELLLHDRRNPRSAMFQVEKIAKHVRLLPGADVIAALAGADAILAASAHRRDGQGELFADRGPASESLARTCRRVSAEVSDALTLRYFSHVYELSHATVTP